MKLGSNKRLANIKTRRETGLDYITQNLELGTPFGRKELQAISPYFPGEEDELRNELDHIEEMMEFVKGAPDLYNAIQMVFMEIKDPTFTVERSEKNILSVVELYEVKSLLLQMRQLLKITKEKTIGDYKGCHSVEECMKDSSGVRPQNDMSDANSNVIPSEAKNTLDNLSVPSEYILEDTEELLDVLDPRKDRINTFYIYDEFSEKLGQLREKKRLIEINIRKEQKETRENLRREHGVNLTPKFDIVVSKSHPDFEKISNLSELEVVDQDYMSVTFQLKPTEKVYGFNKDMEELNVLIDEEEERIREVLSKRVSEYKDIILSNCEKIGKLDLVLAKSTFFIKHNMVKPEIVDEHVIEITEGRNVQVEDILKSKGKEYCPVSISLKDGVTLITGANMGGKTISLKLSGQVPILAQYGFFSPAKHAKVGLSNYIQILIGDSQSVERGLSSFGSEMEELKEILDHGVDRSLILVDEIASGTNPTEGTALTRSLVDYLMTKPYISLITTHFESVTETPGTVNMQVKGLADADFTLLNREIQYAKRRDRINIISKYMDYRLVRVEKNKQVPKDALNIASMLGIDKGIIEGAKKYIK